MKKENTVIVALAVLAAVPGAPMLYKRTQMAVGDRDYAASLQLTLALLAVAGFCFRRRHFQGHHCLRHHRHTR